MPHSFMANRATPAFDQERTPHCHRDELIRLACQRITASRRTSAALSPMTLDGLGSGLARWLTARARSRPKSDIPVAWRSPGNAVAPRRIGSTPIFYWASYRDGFAANLVIAA
jgi:hypothetical protein